MINPFKEVNWRPDNEDIRIFGRTLVIGGCVLLFLAALHRFCTAPVYKGPSVVQLIFLTILVLGIWAWLLPFLAKPIYYIWFFVGACMGTVISNMLILLFFYLLFTPIALIVRLNGRDPLRLKASKGESLWEIRDSQPKSKRYFRQY
jgi:hypothetical protein